MNGSPLSVSKKAWYARAFLVIAILVVSARSFGFEYVDFDDPRIFSMNPHIRDLSWVNIKWMFTDMTYNHSYYSPLLWLFYAISAKVMTFNPQPQHVLNVILHILSSVFVFEIFRLISTASCNHDESEKNTIRTIWGPLAGALFWALNPLRVESVGWVSSRVHLHATVFGFASCWLYLWLRGRDTNQCTYLWRSKLYWLSLGFYVISLFSFPTMIGLPIVLALLDFYVYKIRSDCRLKERLSCILANLLPFLAMLCISLLITTISRLFIQISSLDRGPDPVHPVVHVMVILYTIWHYIAATFWPLNLSPMYRELIELENFHIQFVCGSVMVTLISVATCLLRKRAPGFWCGWLVYLVLIVPFLGLPGRPLFTSDRYCYVGSLVLGFLACWLLIKANKSGSAISKKLTWVCAVIVLIVCGSLSYVQMGIWQNSTTLFTYMIRHLNGSPLRVEPMWRLASVMIQNNQIDAADQVLKEAYAINPRHIMLDRIRMTLLIRKCSLMEKTDPQRSAEAYADVLRFGMVGHFSEDRDYYFKSMIFFNIKLTSMKFPPENQRAMVRLLAKSSAYIAHQQELRGSAAESRNWYQHAYELYHQDAANQSDAESLKTMGFIYMKLGKYEESSELLIKYLIQNGDSADIYLNLAEIRLLQNRRADAEAIMDQILKCWPEYKDKVLSMRQRSSLTLPATRP